MAISGYGLMQQARGFGANEPPPEWERWFAQTARGSAIPAAAKASNNPVQNSEETLAEARAHWADHCAGCHANNGSGEVEMGQNMYPPPPDMRQPPTQQRSDGELFFIIKNGIRMTGMPGWGSPGSDDDSWKLVHFIRHLPQMTFEEQKQMEKLNPKSAAEIAEEAEVESFLKGGKINETNSQHHHH
jgi:mono/diheme cytochrome c family protein